MNDKSTGMTIYIMIDKSNKVVLRPIPGGQNGNVRRI